MLLTITTTQSPATLLGYLLHKHPARFQSFDLSFGQAHVFYPEAADDELEKLLDKGKGWLGLHPLKDEIARRYLKFQPSLFRQALARLAEDDLPGLAEVADPASDQPDVAIAETLSLATQRVGAVMAAIRASGARRDLDLGCGEGRLLRELITDRKFEEIVGMDVSIRSLENARDRLKLDRMPDQKANRITLVHGSLMYRDRRLEGFDAAAVVEVIEHLDPPRLMAFERVLFEFARPGTVVVTTPNREFNVTWENVGPDRLRHPDHRFEWTRQEFQAWAEGIAGRFGYAVKLVPVGPEDSVLGTPTQMGVFERGLN